ncbi:MAG: hypothetical protein KBF89_01635 [Acidimicrobiia bacterium]|nr:hypothetical protein [Acidimicrobiia bacterium]
MKRILSIMLISLLSLVLLASCNSNENDEKNKESKDTKEDSLLTRSDKIKGTQINALLNEFSFDLDSNTASAGDITFVSTNEGKIEHEIVVAKTDLDERALPVDKDGLVTLNFDGKGVEFIDEIEGITRGVTKNLAVNLKPGKYVVFCNLIGHYENGMSTSFTVN